MSHLKTLIILISTNIHIIFSFHAKLTHELIGVQYFNLIVVAKMEEMGANVAMEGEE